MLATLLPCDPAYSAPVELHYAPAENLERIDVDLINSAKTAIDLAAYSLTDWPVIEALNRAERRGVVIRIVLDPSQRHAYEKFAEIADNVRVKRPGPIMHLKAYSIDGIVLRTGSANLSPSGLKQQDNDLLIIRDLDTTKHFKERFEIIWQAARPVYEHPAAVSALEPGGPTADVGPGGCAIKGNINRHGEKIYHVPGGQAYAKVTMGGGSKRWFCSETEALAAGWRKAKR